jgi:N-acetylneuraminic acid mutarotase
MAPFPMLLLLFAAAPPGAIRWAELPPLPDPLGVAGPFAGTTGGALLVAGGANFPGKPPWQGGAKVWHDQVYVLDRPEGAWKLAGTLPRPLGYGVSVSHRDGVLCVGGSDATGHHAEGFRLRWDGERLVTTRLPDLPHPLANASGALVGDVLTIAGGQESPDATPTRAVYRLDLAAPEPRWSEAAPIPGRGRMLATAGAADGAFWIAGGVDLVTSTDKPTRVYLRDAYRLDAGGGWTRLPDLPYPLAASPSPAPAGSGPLLLGGDDGTKVGFRPPEEHPGFNRTILRLDAKAGAWTPAGALPAARVTVPLVRWRGRLVLPSGEARPGVRSPQVWAGTTGDPE